MDELPRDAKAFLAIARDAHDPPDRMAQARVHARLMSVICAPAIAGAPPPAKAASVARGFGAWTSASKIMLAAAVLGLASGGVWMLNGHSAAESPARADPTPVVLQHVLIGRATQAPKPEVESLAAPEPTPPGRAGRPRATQTLRAAPGHTAVASETLSEETQLLARASSQLSRKEVAAALESLEQHRRRFGAGSQLAQERDGLQALAHCLNDQASSRAAARRYIARAPSSVLVARLELSCGL